MIASSLAWLRTFLLTVGSEALVVSPALRTEAPQRWRRYRLILFANLVTHPLVWFVFTRIPARPTWLGAAIAEAWAALAECMLYRWALPRLPWAKALAVSLIANGVSVCICALLLRP